jgi:hypothetical protein
VLQKFPLLLSAGGQMVALAAVHQVVQVVEVEHLHTPTT